MAECTQCGKYTKYNGGLCTECYAISKSSRNIPEGAAEIEGDEKLSGLTDKERAFRYGMIKGRIAETVHLQRPLIADQPALDPR